MLPAKVASAVARSHLAREVMRKEFLQDTPCLSISQGNRSIAFIQQNIDSALLQSITVDVNTQRNHTPYRKKQIAALKIDVEKVDSDFDVLLFRK